LGHCFPPNHVQLGYLAESATWRNAYLYAAFELRHGAAKVGRGQALNSGTVKSIPTEIAARMQSACSEGDAKAPLAPQKPN